MENVTIILNAPEAELFKSFNQFHSTFALMVSSGVFDVKNGSVTVHFDGIGSIQRIERKDDLFNARNK